MEILNPGLRPSFGQSFSICHWNLNSVAAHNLSKIYLLKVYNVIYTYNIICLLEVYLHHDRFFNDDNLRIAGFKLIRVEYPSSEKRDAVCIYHKGRLPIKVINVSYFNNLRNFNSNTKVNGKQCNVNLIYRSSSQSSEEFNTFLTIFCYY